MISDTLVVLAAGNRPLAEVLAAADLGDELVAGGALPEDVCGAIRARAGGPVCADPVAAEPRGALLAALDAGLRNASTLPLRLGVVAALSSVGGIEAFDGASREAAEDVASGAVQLVADPAGWVPELADGLRRALA